MRIKPEWLSVRTCVFHEDNMYVLCVSHPQPRLDVLGVKLCRLLHSFSSIIGCDRGHGGRPSSRRQSRLDTFKSKLIKAMTKHCPTKPLQSPIRCRTIGIENGVLAIKADCLCEFLDRPVVLFQGEKFVALFLELDRLVLHQVHGARRHNGGSSV